MPDEVGHRALLGPDAVTGGGEVGGHPRRVDPQAPQQVEGLRRRHVRTSGQQLEGLPLGVPRTVGPLVDLVGGGQVQGRGQPGARQRGAAHQRAQHGVGLVGHGRGAASRPLGELADLGAAQGQHVARDPAPHVGAGDQRVADARHRATVGVPDGGGLEPQAVGERRCGRGGVAPELGHRRAGAGGPTHLGGQPEGDQVVVDVEDAGEPAGGLEAERGRHRVLGQGAADHRGRPVGADQGGEDLDLRPQQVGDLAEHVADAEHQCGVDDVLAGEPAVQPPRRAVVHARAEQGHQRDDGVAAGLGRDGETGQVVGPDQADEGGVDGAGRDAGVDQDPQPGPLDLDHRREHRGVGEDVAGALVAGPEESAHPVSLTYPAPWPG